MRLIVLYGPPASGKLTVAKALANINKYPLLHNHLVADFANTLFDFGTDEYVKLASELRSRAVDAALKAKLPGLIMTFAYGLETKEGEKDDIVLKTIAARVKRCGGTVHFVRLTCDLTELVKRVDRKDRKEFHKLTKPSVLKHILTKLPKTKEAIPFTDSLLIDTQQLTPLEAAKRIMRSID